MMKSLQSNREPVTITQLENTQFELFERDGAHLSGLASATSAPLFAGDSSSLLKGEAVTCQLSIS